MTTQKKWLNYSRICSITFALALSVPAIGYTVPAKADEVYPIIDDSMDRTTILIDPGHGGMDSGALALDQQYEKDFNLEYAMKIGSYIQQIDPSIQVLYTRVSDEIPWVDENTSLDFEIDDLNGRMYMANNISPDYFLCLHFNAAEDPGATGYEAFIRSDDLEDRQVYALIGQKLGALGYSMDLGLISTDEAPLQLVDMVYSNSMLLELGFLTNPFDLASINDPSMKEAICYSIAEAYVEAARS